VSASLTTIQADLGASAEQLEWTVNGYNLVMAVLLMPAAALGDRYGRRRMFAVGIALFTAASAACAAAPGVVVLVLARAVQGAGAAFVSALAMTLVSAAYPAERRGSAIGVLQGGSGIAVLAGPGLGGVITHAVGWEFVFWLNVPIGLVLLPLVLAKCDESRGRDTALDVRGLVLIMGAVLGVAWALARSSRAGVERVTADLYGSTGSQATRTAGRRRTATAAAHRATSAAQAPIAGPKPSTKAAGEAYPPVAVKTATKTASPSTPPSSRTIALTPEALPMSAAGTAPSTALAVGASDIDPPMLVTRNGTTSSP